MKHTLIRLTALLFAPPAGLAALLGFIKRRNSCKRFGIIVISAWLCILSVHTVVAEIAGPGKDMIMAYYYPWYLKGDWTRHKYQGTPVLGEYGTDDPATAEKHIEWSSTAGIDALIVSWWGKDSLTDKHFNKGFLQAKNINKTKFLFIYEAFGVLDKEDGKADGIVDFSKPGPMKKMVADFICMRDEYFKHPSYLKIGGKSGVVLYVTRSFRNFSSENIRSLEKELGMELFLIADEPFMGRQADPATAWNGLGKDGKPVFKAYTAYNMFESKNVLEGESALDYMRREAFPIYARWGKKTVFCPHVMPSYHDFRGNRVLKGTAEDFRKMIDEVKSIPSMPVGDGINRIIMVTSFNEWWEGSTIEPAAEYGSSYLEVIKSVKGQ
jgi:hypothetical protein